MQKTHICNTFQMKHFQTELLSIAHTFRVQGGRLVRLASRSIRLLLFQVARCFLASNVSSSASSSMMKAHANTHLCSTHVAIAQQWESAMTLIILNL